jgi:DNA processing protein
LDEARRAGDLGISLVGPGDEGYPSPLVHAWDPPPLLYARGTWTPRDAAAVSLVGARRCTLYGRTQARRLAADLALRRLTVVSGLARGVDTAAHEGALEPGAGRTVAVLGSGLARPYPRENLDLLTRVAERGAVLSAFPLDAAPLPHHFPHRNRIIASLALGTVVVEAGARSGSLITARLALEAGRDVMVIPGPVDDPLSLGGHRLLRDGAAPVRNAEEVLEVLGMDSDDVPVDAGPGPDGDAGVVLGALEGPARDTDTLVQSTGLDVARVRTALVELELEGTVRSFPGGFWGRA